MTEPSGPGNVIPFWPVWTRTLDVMIRSLLMHVVASEPAATRTLATLRDHLTLAPAAFGALLERMQKACGLVARAARRRWCSTR